MSCEGGKNTRVLSHEHVPDDAAERERILSYGGKIYRYFKRKRSSLIKKFLERKYHNVQSQLQRLKPLK